ncbi:MAG: cupin domain-containing protein [Nitrospirae bacterium]|nr:cupin domain-containing protein [Nitrospirota bacterium]MCL5421404.1 cupin domain-containing protein [Nitrospirota bacterium]
MKRIINWKSLNQIEDGCGGIIYKVLDTENSGLKNVEIAMCIFAPGEIAKLHYHERLEEIYFIIEGEGEIELNGKWFPVQAEESIPIPVGVKHRLKNTSVDNPLRFLSINSPEWQVSDMIVVKE